MARFHPGVDWLAAYANGAIDEHTAVLIATHLTFCPQCRKAIRDFEAIGGALLDAIDLDALIDQSISLPNALPTEHEKISAFDDDPINLPDGSISELVPRPLLRYVFNRFGTTDINALPWKFYGAGIRRAILFETTPGGATRLLRAQPGAVFPHHGHGSEELTVVLKGAYKDDTGRYGVGDVQCISEDAAHQPIVENSGECIALVVSEKPTIPTGFIARLVQRIIDS